MCGISAVILKNNKSSDLRGKLVKMMDIIKHRGPDDEGYLLIDNDNKAFCFGGKDTKVYGRDSNLGYLPKSSINENEKYVSDKLKVALGFRRLSILDLSPSGHQPMSYMKGRYWIVFNGEIYNYVELKHELIKYGYFFQSNTDTEVVMAAYNYWGIDCFDKFNGMWALVLIDLNKNELIASRDRFGIKPLYYCNVDNYLLFASEIKQFLAFGDLNIEPHIEKIKTDVFFDTREYLEETAFTNVYRCPKAHYLKINISSGALDQLRFTKYYEFRFFNDNNNTKYDINTAKRFSEEYYNLLQDSVSLRLRSDVAVGTCLSGGLDSSSVVYYVNKLLNKNNIADNQKTFSLVFNSSETKYCDESEFIDKLSKQFNLNSYKFDPSVQDVIKNYNKMIFAMDTPQHSTLMSYIFTYKLVKKNGVTVTLDGQGADELQAGYLPYFRYYFTDNSFKDIFKKLISNYNVMEGSNKEIINGVIFSIIKKMNLKKITDTILQTKKLQSPFKVLNKKLFDDFNDNLQTLFHYGDRGSMINSVEARFPMMDYRLVEFWMGLPAIYKIHNGFTKYIARLSMNKKLPDEIVWRKDKKGWEMPQKEWIKDGLGILIKKEIEQSHFLKEININFEFDRFNMSINDHRHWKLPIKLFNLALWYKMFFEEFKERL